MANAINESAIKKLKLVFTVVDRPKAEFYLDVISQFDVNCQIAVALGAESMVVHLWDGITSDAYFQNNVDAYSHLRKMTDTYGLKLLIENVVCNKADPMQHWCELRESFPDICFVYDTKMAAFHSQTDLLYQDAYAWLWSGGHICHYHVNDYAGGHKEWSKLRTLPIGQGHIDFERFFRFVNSTGYRGTFTVEATALNQDGVVDIGMLNRQFAYIREQLMD